MQKHFLVLTAVAAFAIAAPIARGQAAAEYRLTNDVPGDWPKQAVRAAHGMVATDEELGDRKSVV